MAGDSHSGVSQVQVQYARTGTSTWTELCPVRELPYSCEFNTVSSVSVVDPGVYLTGNATQSAAANSTISGPSSPTT